MRTSVALVAIALSCGTAAAQSPAAAPGSPAFERAVVQVSASRATRRAPVTRGDRFEARGQTLPTLIAFAYGVNFEHVVDGPNWLDLDRFDIAATSPSGTTPPQQRQMLQALLSDRFKLTVRNESRPQEAWSLVIGRGTLQVKSAAGADFTGCRGVPQAAGATAVINEQDCRNVTMAQIAARLQAMRSGYFTGPVTDATGLTGTWDARFAVTPSSARAAANDGPSVFDAAERMGLKLERRDTPVPVLVIASVAQNPTPSAPGAAEARARPVRASEFEVVTVRPFSPVPGRRGGGPGANLGLGPTIQPNGRIFLRNVTVRDLIAFAWDIPADMVFNSTGVLDTDRFEIIGDAPASLPRPVDVDEVRPMVRSLLASRFGLAVHEDIRQIDAFVLTAKREIRMAAGNNAKRGSCVSTPERIPPELWSLSGDHVHQHVNAGTGGSTSRHGPQLHQRPACF